MENTQIRGTTGLGETGRDWETLADTGRHWERLGETGRHWETMRETGTFRAATCKETTSPFTQTSVKATLKRIQSSLAKKVSAI